MSERSEVEHVQRVRAGTVPLSVLIEFISQKVYTDLMRLVDLLPSKTDLEKKIEIATFFSRTQLLFVRLEALVKWSNSASKVDKCEKISNFLEEQSFFLINTANALSRLLRETLSSARLPPFSVLLAVDIFTNKTYTRLPKAIKNVTLPLDVISDEEKKQALIDLNCIIQNRLSMTELPRQFRIIKIANGRVRFVVPHEFSVTLTLMSEAIDFPWRILEINFLMVDVSMNYQNLVHPAQTKLIMNQVQSRLLYRHFDKRRPLIHLYDMLHAFSLSLQLDMLHEQAQRARVKRPADQLTIELYRPNQSLTISYWHGLARTQYDAVMGLDGKLHPMAYLLTIHVDPTDPQRPLCVTHRPELPQSKSHRIGVILRGDCLSIETLLARSVVARAEHILQELKQELLVLSPGPVCLADAPLCLYVPLLWPCGTHELLQIRVDSIQGFVCATFPLLTSMDTEFGIVNWSVTNTQSPSIGSFENYSLSSVLNALNSLETAFNQVSARRVRLVSPSGNLIQSHENEQMCSVQSRSLRNLSHGDSRWRSLICQALEHLRLCLGLARLLQTAKIHRPFWQPFKRRLPLILSQTQIMENNSWSQVLIRLQQSHRHPVMFVQLFPNNEHYVVCEVYSTPLSVDYRYYLIVCNALSEHMTVTTNSQGLLLYTNEIGAATGPHNIRTGLFLRVTHFVELRADAIWSHNPSSSLSLLRTCIEKAQSTILTKRSDRLNQLLKRLTDSCKLSNASSESYLGSLESETIFGGIQVTVPTLGRIIGISEENIMSTSLIMELSCAGIEHTGLHYDGSGSLSAIQITSIPFVTPNWYPENVIPLADYVHEMMLRPHFDPFTHRRNWQLDVLFTGITAPLDGSLIQSSTNYLRHQTAEWTVVRLEHFSLIARNVIMEWEHLCCMHALCYQVISNPAYYLPSGVQIYSYNLKTLSLVYGSVYLVEISYSLGHGFVLALGFKPIKSQVDSASFAVEHSNSSNVDFNPHMIVRNHFEELLNISKSVYYLSCVLTYTMNFFRAVEYLYDPTLSYNGLKFLQPTNINRPVRGIVLIALSTHDLILIYRASLSLHITLVPQQQSTSCHALISIQCGKKNQNCVQLRDAHSQLTDPKLMPNRADLWVNQLNDRLSYQIMPLPAFQQFLKSLQDCFQPNSDEPCGGLTVDQFLRLTKPSLPSKSKFTPIHNTKFGSSTHLSQPHRACSKISILESYMSTSLLFQSAILATQALDITIMNTKSDFNQSDTTVDESGNVTVMQTGSFISNWQISGLSAQLSMSNQTIGVELNWWKLKLHLTSLYNPTTSENVGTPNQTTLTPDNRWPQETLNVFEEFFHNRVCSYPFQPSAVTAFFRLLLLPPYALRAMARVLAFDLHSPAQAPVYLRIGLIALGSTNARVTTIGNTMGANQLASSPHNLITFDTGMDLQSGLPGIVIKPPKIILQLLIMRAHIGHQSKNLIPLAQLVVVGYDWETNQVVIFPPSGNTGTVPTPGSAPGGVNSTNSVSDVRSVGLLQLLHDTDVESKANLTAQTNGDSALVQLVVLITQTVAASYPISSAGSASVNSNSSNFPLSGVSGGVPQPFYG